MSFPPVRFIGGQGMANSSLRDVIKKTGSKYTLVLAVAKRARQIVDEQQGDVLATEKPATIAIDEICNGKVEYQWRSDTAR